MRKVVQKTGRSIEPGSQKTEKFFTVLPLLKLGFVVRYSGSRSLILILNKKFEITGLESFSQMYSSVLISFSFCKHHSKWFVNQPVQSPMKKANSYLTNCYFASDYYLIALF